MSSTCLKESFDVDHLLQDVKEPSSKIRPAFAIKNPFLKKHKLTDQI
jgi:hypothetical protein